VCAWALHAGAVLLLCHWQWLGATGSGASACFARAVSCEPWLWLCFVLFKLLRLGWLCCHGHWHGVAGSAGYRSRWVECGLYHTRGLEKERGSIPTLWLC
jgi:hypothetical protein